MYVMYVTQKSCFMAFIHLNWKIMFTENQVFMCLWYLYNCQNVEATKMPFRGEWVNKLYPDNGDITITQCTKPI